MDHHEDNTQHTSTQAAQQQAQVGVDEQEKAQVDAEAQERAQAVAAKRDRDAKTFWLIFTGVYLYLSYLGLNKTILYMITAILATHLNLFRWRYIFLSLFFSAIVLTFWNVF